MQRLLLALDREVGGPADRQDRQDQQRQHEHRLPQHGRGDRRERDEQPRAAQLQARVLGQCPPHRLTRRQGEDDAHQGVVDDGEGGPRCEGRQQVPPVEGRVAAQERCGRQGAVDPAGNREAQSALAEVEEDLQRLRPGAQVVHEQRGGLGHERERQRTEHDQRQGEDGGDGDHCAGPVAAGQRDRLRLAGDQCDRERRQLQGVVREVRQGVVEHGDREQHDEAEHPHAAGVGGDRRGQPRSTSVGQLLHSTPLMGSGAGGGGIAAPGPEITSPT